VGDTPETVEYLGVKNLVQAAIKHFGTAPADEKLVFDFTNHRKSTWGAVDDVVMGGVSESDIRFVDGTALATSQQNSAALLRFAQKL